jgi:phosphodiesterase/alkaline phosphatase D-like protein
MNPKLKTAAIILISGSLLLVLFIRLSKTEHSTEAAYRVASHWAGGVDHCSARITAKFTAQGKVRLVISTDSLDLKNPSYSLYQLSDKQNDFRITFLADSLRPDQTYYYTFEYADKKLMKKWGMFKTFSNAPFSYTFIFSACGKTGSERIVYDKIREQAPLFYLITGDLFYGDIKNNCREQFQCYYDSTLQSTKQAALYRAIPIAYMWDDHDFGPGNSGRDANCKQLAKRAYKTYVPHYPLAFDSDTMPLSQSFTAGRVRFVLTDLRSEKSKPTYKNCELLEAGSNFGSYAHLEWFKKELLLAKKQGQLVAWVSGIPFINYAGGPNYQCNEDDDWGGFQQEREQIIRFVNENNINICILSGDAHAVAIDDGTHAGKPYSDETHIPVFQAASLDKPGSYKGGPYSHGHHPGGGQYGLVRVVDNGEQEICMEWKAMNEKNEVVRNESGRPIEYKFCRTLLP